MEPNFEGFLNKNIPKEKENISSRTINELKETFGYITRQFDLDDWRTVRNEEYWMADFMSTVEGLKHKIKLIEYYNKHGVPRKL